MGLIRINFNNLFLFISIFIGTEFINFPHKTNVFSNYNNHKFSFKINCAEIFVENEELSVLLRKKFNSILVT